MLVVYQLQAQPFSNVLECVAEGAMPKVMEECRHEDLLDPIWVDFSSHAALDDFHQLAADVKGSKAVCEPRMGRPGIHQLREPKLLHTAQALKRASLDGAPENILELLITKFDNPMQWIANALWSEGHDEEGRPKSGFSPIQSTS
jgi:hypothetical protein